MARWLRISAVSIAASVLGSVMAHAEMTPKTIQVATRTLAFVVNPPVGPTEFAILYDPAIPASATDAGIAMKTLDGGLSMRQVTVLPVLLPVSELSRLSHYRFVLVTSGLQDRYDAIAEAARGHGVLTIAADFDCVRRGRCTMAVTAEPRVEILVNRAVSQANGVEFAAAFRILISEM